MPIKSLDRILVLNITLILEAVLLLVATVWSQVAHIELLPALTARGRAVAIGVLAGGLMALSGLVLMWLSRFLGNTFKMLATLRQIVMNELAPVFSTLTIFDIVLVAAASGFCEEVLFRGVLQQQWGLLPTSLLFGFFHLPSLRHLPYGLWAAGAGAFLGWLYLSTHCLWTPIVAHATSNLIVLIFLRYVLKPSVEAESGDAPEKH